MTKLFNFKDNKQKSLYLILLIITFFDLLLFKEKYILSQIIEFGLWLWFFLKIKTDELLPVKTAIIFLSISAFFYLISQTALSEHFLNAGIIFILLAVIVSFTKILV